MMKTKTPVGIPVPMFGLYETVMITWNGEHKVSIVKRWFDFDDESWWYEFSGWQGKYPEQMMYRQLQATRSTR